MEKVYEFLRDCGTFFVSTINNGKPETRPFGAVMSINDELYLATGKLKNVYKQFKDNPNIQIVALKSGTRNWVRIDGQAQEINDLELKEQMLKECPILTNRYSGASDENYALIKVKIIVYNFY